jgi:hypothetical protein
VRLRVELPRGALSEPLRDETPDGLARAVDRFIILIRPEDLTIATWSMVRDS